MWSQQDLVVLIECPWLVPESVREQKCSTSRNSRVSLKEFPLLYLDKTFYLICTLSVQFFLLFEPIHHLIHEFQRDLSIFKFGSYVVIFNCCNRKINYSQSSDAWYHLHITALCVWLMLYMQRVCSVQQRNLLMFSMSKESTTDFFISSLAMALSKAFCFTILLHSWYFILASLSFGRTFTTYQQERERCN